MSRGRFLIGFFVVAMAAFGLSAYGSDTPEHPSELFKKNCAKCHGEKGNGDTMRGRHLKARNFTDAEWQADVTDAQLVKSVTDGKDDMPPFGKKLTQEEIQSLVKNDVRGFAPKK
ncbi:MAG TPA: cytochrome c [Thermoanaerobaculia bacterium]|nr:cytochrome c [Thermoanaerobaculia bacterium]